MSTKSRTRRPNLKAMRLISGYVETQEDKDSHNTEVLREVGEKLGNLSTRLLALANSGKPLTSDEEKAKKEINKLVASMLDKKAKVS